MKDVSVRKVKREKLNFWERTYLLPIFQGMSITLKHLLANLIGGATMPVVEYPDKKKSCLKAIGVSTVLPNVTTAV